MEIITCLFLVGLIYSAQCGPMYGSTTVCETPQVPGTTTVCETTPNLLGLLQPPMNMPPLMGLNFQQLLPLLQILLQNSNDGCAIPQYLQYGQVPLPLPLPVPIPPVCDNPVPIPSLLQRPMNSFIGIGGLPPNLIGLGGIGMQRPGIGLGGSFGLL